MVLPEVIGKCISADSSKVEMEARHLNIPYLDKVQVPKDILLSRMEASSIEEGEKFISDRNLDLIPTGLFRDTTKDDVQVKIVGGTSVSAGEFSFYVVSGGQRLCGASLIAPDMLLSAAHCGIEAFRDGAYIGGTQIINYNGEYFDVDTVAIIPDYTGAPFYENDVMLIKLSDSTTTTPVTLNFDGNVPSDGEMLTVIGHGTTSEGGDISRQLLKVDVPYVNPDECFSTTFVPQDSSMCAGGIIGKDSCQGKYRKHFGECYNWVLLLILCRGNPFFR